jgi:CHAT domain-containing protein/predicted negative regulator of RcsB-dependent stress response
MAWPSTGITTLSHGLGAAALCLSLVASVCFAQEPKATAAYTTAEARERDAETLRSLVAEGQLLYERDEVRLDGYQYCSQAVALADRGEFRESIRAASKALVLAQAEGNDHLEALAKRDLAIAYNYAGNLERAEQYAREALGHPNSDPQRVGAPASKVIGDVQVRRGDYTRALASYQHALAISGAKYKPLVQLSIANVEVKLGHTDQAEALLASIPDSDGPGIRDMVLRTRGNLRLAQGRYQESLEAYNGALKQAQGVDAVYQRMWLNEGIARSQLGLKNRPAALAAYRNAVELADTMRAKFRSDEFKAGLFGDTQRMFEDAIALAVATGNFEEAWRFSERSRARALLDMIRERTTQHATAEAGAAAVIDSATLRKALRDDEAIVEYHALEDQLVVWVIRRDGITGAAVPISRADLTTSVEGFRRSIVNLQRSARTKARDLYDVLIAKVALRNGERLIVVPHGPLHYLPFQALYDGKTYLIENHSVSVAPSASVVYQAASASVRPGGEFVGFGNPDLGKAELALPGAQREVQQISGLFANARVYYQRDATKARFRDTAGKSGMLHVAAHAEVDEVDPLYSRVLLAPDDKDSGRLEAREIFDLDLSRVRLVTLSACESGLGKVDRGDEIIGFTRSFLSAGVSGLIVSLWPVSDESTELLMSTMYQQLRSGQSAQDAMRAGQVALLKDRRFQHPFFWAPFNLVGNWRLTVNG